MNEFELIARYFTKPAKGAILGVGDDCALFSSKKTIAASTDMLVEGVHFFPGEDPFLLGKKSLSVNLSDMAAMGAEPRWALLALSLPAAEESWLEGFSKGFMMQAENYAVDLIGGDTTRGPLVICVQIMGKIDAGLALRRDAARIGDEIWVSGNLGDAALGLYHLQGEIRLDGADLESCLKALRDPVPRVELGLALSGISRCAIDISDGFCADLSHILERSEVSAIVDYSSLPVSKTMEKYVNEPVGEKAILSGGDDYELCFTASEEKYSEIIELGNQLGIRLSRVGRITEGSGLHVLDEKGREKGTGEKGYAHFR